MPPRRGGRPSQKTESPAARAAGTARLCGARRGLVRSARALAAAALLALSGALALPATAEAQTPTLSIADAEATEGGNVTFTVTLSAAAAADVTATWTASIGSGDTAVAAEDLNSTTGPVTVEAGDTTGTFTVSTAQDLTDEENETFTVTLSGVSSNAQLAADPTATGTINDDDPTPTLSFLENQMAAGYEADGVTFTVHVSSLASKPVTATWTASIESGDTASTGDLGGSTTGTVTVPVEENFGKFTVPTADDSTIEENETFTVTLSDVSSNATLAADPTATGTINDDDAGGIRVTDAAAVTEGGTATFTVTLTPASAEQVTVDWVATQQSNVGDAAVPNLDFGSDEDQTLTFAPGETMKTVSVPTIDDALDEEDAETFALALVNPTNAQLAGGAIILEATGTITDNDDPPTLSVADVLAEEGNSLTFTATLSTQSGREVTVAWAAATLDAEGDGAAAGTDFTAGSGTLTFAAQSYSLEDGDLIVTPGQTEKTFTVDTIEDSTVEMDEKFTVTLSNPTNAGISDATAKGTITDDDGTTPTNCTLNTGDIWCGVVTVGEETTGTTTTGHGFSSITGGSFGTLTDDSGDQTFTYGTETYVVGRVVVGAGSFAGELGFRVRRGSSNDFLLADDDRAKLALHVDGSTTPFAFRATATYSSSLGYIWSPSGLDWSSATRVTVRLRELPDAPTDFEAAVGNEQVPLTWDAPASGANITRHEFRYKTGNGSYPAAWTPIATSAPGGTNEASFTVTGLTNEIAHTFELRAVNDSGASAAVEDGPVTPTPGICDRTQKIQDVILAELTGVTDCAAVTVANLASITKFGVTDFALFQQGITSLQAGDFAGLTGLTKLNLNFNQLTSLPAGIFSGLTAIRDIQLNNNQLTSLAEETFAGLANLTAIGVEANKLTALPAGLFTGLTTLKDISLGGNKLSSLDAGVFDGLTALTDLSLNDGELTSLDTGVFDGLTALERLTLRNCELTSLPGTVFSGLTALQSLRLDKNDLTRTGLPAGLFSGVTALRTLYLNENKLESLPDGLLSGLTALRLLDLAGNTADPVPLTVTVEKVGTDQARAKVPAGAPFAVDFTPAVVNGSLPASDTKLAVPAGAVAGTPVTVTRTSGTTAAVTVDIDLTTQPSLPAAHSGYEFAKAAGSEPKEILSEDPNNAPVFDPAEAEREVPENSAAGTDVGAVIPAATDADNDTLDYSLEGDDARFFDFDDSTRQITTKANVTYNYEAAKNSYEVKVKADDGTDSATLAVTIRLTDVAERPAPPAPPMLSPISGSSTSLMASWVKPGRNGGPDITGYGVEYREGDGGWTDFAHDGTGVSTTITGLTAGASYQVRVQAENGELDSAWSDPSNAAVPNPAAVVLPRITAVRVTSVPELERDTYGRGETIRFTVYFSAPVTVTGSPHLTFSLGNRNATRKVDAPYESGSGTAALVFGYVVQDGDEDDNGIFLVDGAALGRAGPVVLDAGETITALGGGLAADLSSSERGSQRDHKVDGSRALEGPAPTVVGRLKVTSWPVRGDGVHALGDTILFTLTLSEPVRVEGQPQPTLAFELGGGTHEARYWGLTDTEHEMGSPPPEPRPEGVKLHFGYTVKAGDRDDDGVSVGANAIDLGGARVRSTVTGFDADLTHVAVGPFSDHRVDAGTETVPPAAGVTILDTDGSPLAGDPPRLVIPEGGQGRYGLKLNTRPAHPVNLKAIQSDGDEDLAVLASFTQPSIAPGAWERPSWVDIAAAADADSENGERIFQNVVHSRDPAYNDLVLPNVVVVEADDDPKPTGPAPPEITAVEVASEPELEPDTYGYGETIRFRVEFSEPVTVGGQPHFTFSLGNRNAGRRVDAPYESGNGTAALVFGYEVQRRDEDDNGIFLLVGRDFTDRAGPVGLGRGGSIRAVEGGVAADLTHDTGRGAQRGHRVDGSRPEEPVPTGPTVRSLAVNSWPQSGGDAYRADDPIVFTATFSEKVQVEGQPTLAFDLGGEAREAEYYGLSDEDYVEGGPRPRPRPEGAKMHFAYTVQRGDRDTDGVSVGANAISLGGATVQSAATELDADLAHAATGPLSDPVDAVAGSPATTAAPLTAEFQRLPSSHEGTAFTFRLAFSEDVAVSAAALRDHALTVTGGTVTGAARADGRADLWTVTVTPSGTGEILISLPPGRDCAAAGAVCTADGRQLSAGVATLVAGPPVNAPARGAPTIAGTPRVGEILTASTSGISDADGLANAEFAHQWIRGGADIPGATGATYTAVEADEGERLKVRVAFEDDAGHAEALTSAATDAVAARPNAPAQGAPTIAGTPRVGETLTASTSDITDADGLDNAEFAHQWLRGGADIPGATGASYTAVEADEGERLKVRVGFEDDAGNDETLTSGSTKRVAARPMPKVSVADARVREAAGATLDFAVTLSAPAPGTVTVGYRTLDASAKAGEDYEARSGTLRFAPGETAKTVAVPVLDDAHDEGTEILVFRLENVRGALLADRFAVGRIENDDHMPAAWLARFGRTVTDQVLDAVGERLAASRAAGARVRLAGQALPFWDDAGERAKAANAHADANAGASDRAMRGDARDRTLRSDAQDRALRGDARDRTLRSDAQDRALRGDARDRALRSDARSRESVAALREWLARAGANAAGSGAGADEWRAWDGEPEDRVRSRELTGRDFVTGTSFELTGGSAEAGGHAALWGRGAISRFDGREGELTLDGEVTTGLMGADWASAPGSGAGRWTAGLAVGHALGTGSYSESDCTSGGGSGGDGSGGDGSGGDGSDGDGSAGDGNDGDGNDPGASGCSGEVESTLTGIWPYAGFELTERVSAWAAAGYGAGELALAPGVGSPFTADLTMTMGAAGLRGEVLVPPPEGGLALAVKGVLRPA